MGEMHWTPALVEERLAEAAEVLKRMPTVKVQSYFSLWPKVIAEAGDVASFDPPRLKRPKPSPDAITRMEATLPWLAWLEPEDAKLVWARAERTPWKPICWRFGISRATACRRMEYALSLIAWRLNGQKAPAKRSRAYLVSRVREARPSPSAYRSS